LESGLLQSDAPLHRFERCRGGLKASLLGSATSHFASEASRGGADTILVISTARLVESKPGLAPSDAPRGGLKPRLVGYQTGLCVSAPRSIRSARVLRRSAPAISLSDQDRVRSARVPFQSAASLGGNAQGLFGEEKVRVGSNEPDFVSDQARCRSGDASFQSKEARLQSTEASFRTTACRFRLAACKCLETLGDSRWFAAGEPAVVASAVLAPALHLVGPTLLIARVAIWLATLFGSTSDLSNRLHAAPRSRPAAARALPGPAHRVASLVLLIARVPNFRQTICESMSDVFGSLKQGWRHAWRSPAPWRDAAVRVERQDQPHRDQNRDHHVGRQGLAALSRLACR
jgi:hypothetical protein